MKAIIKLLFWVGGAVALLALVVIAAFALLFDPNALRDDIQRLVADKTGRTLNIEGELSLSFYPWLGFAAGTTTLSNADGFADDFMARFDNASASVKLLPLLSRRVELSQVTLSGLQLNLERKADGSSNWDDLLALQGAQTTDTPSAAGPSFQAESVGGIQLENARVRYRDAEAGTDYTLLELDLKTGGMNRGQFFDFNGSAQVVSVDPGISGPATFSGQLNLRDGAATIASPEFVIRASGDSIPGDKLKIGLSGNELDFIEDMVTIDRPVLTLNGTGGGDPWNSLDATIRGAALELRSFDALKVNAPSMIATMRSPTFTDGVEAKVDAQEMQAAIEAQTATLSTVKVETMGMTITAPVVNATQVIDAASFDANIAIAKFAPRPVLARFGATDIVTADPKALSSAVVNADLRYTPERTALRNMKARLDQSNITGSLSYSEAGQLRFDLAVDEVDIDRYRAPSPESQGEAASVAEVDIPVEKLRELNLDGALRIAKMRLVGLNSSDVNVGIKASNGKLRVSPARANLYGGSYNGDIQLDVTGQVPVLSLNERLENVQFGPFSKDLLDANRISGVLSGRITVSGRGLTADAITNSANGTAQFSFKDGAYEGTDVWYRVRRARAVIERKEPPPAPAEKRTRFADLSGTATIKDGVMYSDDLSMVLPFMKVRGQGNLKMLSQELDFRLRGDLVDRPELTADVNDLVGITVPFKVTGKVSEPEVSVDMGAVLADLAKRKLGQKLGVTDPAKPEQTAKEAVDQKKEEIKDAIDAKAKDLLRGILGGKKDDGGG